MNRADPNWAHFWKKKFHKWLYVVSKMSRDPWFDCPTCNSNLEWNLVFVCWPYYHRVDFLNRIYSLFCVTFEYVRRNRWYRNSITCQRKRKRILMHQLSWCVCRGRAVGTWRGRERYNHSDSGISVYLIPIGRPEGPDVRLPHPPPRIVWPSYGPERHQEKIIRRGALSFSAGLLTSTIYSMYVVGGVN